jgi:hypothetical protein
MKGLVSSPVIANRPGKKVRQHTRMRNSDTVRTIVQRVKFGAIRCRTSNSACFTAKKPALSGLSRVSEKNPPKRCEKAKVSGYEMIN